MKLKKADATSTRPRKPTKVAASTRARATATSTKLNNKIPCSFAGDYSFYLMKFMNWGRSSRLGDGSPEA